AGVALGFLGDQLSLTIQGNENLLRQIVLNLICNAIRHTPAEGRIQVTTRAHSDQSGRRALVEVTDTGSGIAPYLLERVFETGFSANGDTPGLGLAVSKRLMTAHGGEIRVFVRFDGGGNLRLDCRA